MVGSSPRTTIGSAPVRRVWPLALPPRRVGTALTVLMTLGAATAAVVGAQSTPLQSGPMLGYSQMTEVAVWVQTTVAASVQIAYWPQGDEPARTLTGAVETHAATAHTATLRAEGLTPGTRYEYEVLVDGISVALPYPTSFATQELWQWRNDPPEFTIAVASCFYVNEPAFDRPGEPYGSDFQILEHLRARQPDAMVWLGDNTYLREADWHSRSGILHRYTHTRSYPGLQPLLASTHHYATWDDHDFGPNNSDRSYWAQGLTREAFELFWPNPSHGVQGVPGIATAFEWADTLFVLLDDRTNRTPNDRVTGKRTMLGDAQVEWLIDTLVSSTATLKFVAVGGQFLNPVDGFETFATFPEERERILQLLEAERVGGVFFLTGDRHRTELSKLDRRGLYPLYDLTVSPLTAGVYRGQTEVNTLRVDGTLLQDHNFALLHVAGPRTDRVLTITLVDQDGTDRWSQEIRVRDLFP